MTPEEFKQLKPEYKDLQGDELWSTMENYLLQQQAGNEVIKQIMPIWKTHTLRWLFYRKIPNLVISKPSRDKYTSSKRCAKCKKGVNLKMGLLVRQEDNSYKYISYCPHCGDEYKEEPNTNISHKLYKITKKTSNLFWLILDKIHLVRSSHESRYSMFGDESRYVEYWKYDLNWNPKKPVLKKRKWWEYILIEKPFHDF